MPALYQNLPNSPGVYLMKNREGGIIYVGKAGNLKKRVSSYFLRANDGKTERLVKDIYKIDFLKTDTVFEALILEANLIKKYSPYYNIKDKDDKSFLYAEITKEEFPRVILTRGKDIRDKVKGEYFGPYTSASSVRQALRIIRKIFPYSLHKFNKVGSAASNFLNFRKTRPCFDYEIGLCPGTCAGLISKKDYLKNIKNIKFMFQGKKKKILADLNKEMKEAAKNLEFEKAEKFRRQIFALKHIQDISFINTDDFYNSDKNFGSPRAEIRIEGYDISNISGTSAVGSMVVFINGAPDKNEYRKFKIRTVFESNDTGMLREVLERRFSRHADDWPLPNLILIDGGKPQVNIAKQVLEEMRFISPRLMRLGRKIPVIGIAKGPERKKNEFHGAIPKWADESTLIKVRDEAHRFAIAYHKKVRGREFMK